MGADATGASSAVASMMSRETASDFDGLVYYTREMIRPMPPARRQMLSKMLQRPEEAYRAFAAAELAWEVPDEVMLVDLVSSLHDPSIIVRLCAASSLLMLRKDTVLAERRLEEDLVEATDFLALDQAVATLARHRVSLAPIESRLREMHVRASGSRKDQLQHVIIGIAAYKNWPR